MGHPVSKKKTRRTDPDMKRKNTLSVAKKGRKVTKFFCIDIGPRFTAIFSEIMLRQKCFHTGQEPPCHCPSFKAIIIFPKNIKSSPWE